MKYLTKFLKSKWIILFLVPLSYALLHLLLRSKPTISPMLINHRGGAGLAPENTLAAIETGLQYKPDKIEIDIRRSTDGVIFLMHNDTVDHTTNGQGAVADLTWSEISRLDAGSHFSPAFAGEPVPTLETVLTWLKTQDTATLLIEVKDPQSYPGLSQELVAMIEQFELQQQVQVISFDRAWMTEFQRQAPDIPAGFLYYWVGCPPQSPAIQVVSVYWPSVILDPTLIWRMHRAGFPVVVYAVNNISLMRGLLWLGVDGIITDHPDHWLEATR